MNLELSKAQIQKLQAVAATRRKQHAPHKEGELTFYVNLWQNPNGNDRLYVNFPDDPDDRYIILDGEDNKLDIDGLSECVIESFTDWLDTEVTPQKKTIVDRVYERLNQTGKASCTLKLSKEAAIYIEIVGQVAQLMVTVEGSYVDSDSLRATGDYHAKLEKVMRKLIASAKEHIGELEK